MKVAMTDLQHHDTADLAAELLQRLKDNISFNDDHGLAGSDMDITELALHDRLLDWMENGDL